MSIKNDLNKYTPREEQKKVLEYIKNVLQKKPDNKFFLLNMPVGIGKSHAAVMISEYITSNILKGTKVDIITAGKLLQDQYEETYDEIKSLRGKENYECVQYSCSCVNGKEFNRLNKSKCDFCPYDMAKNCYITSDVGLTNFHLYLINMIYGNSIMKDRDSKLLIVDEADKFDDVMSDFISIKITETTIKKYLFANEVEILKQLKSVVNLETYIDFLRYFDNEINNTIIDIDNALSSGRDKNSARRDSRHQKMNSILDIPSNDIKFMQLINDLRQLSVKVSVFLTEYDDYPDNWVVESSYNEKTKMNELSLEPIWAHYYLQKFIWSKYDIVVLMSGTILDKNLFSEINGIDVDKSVYYSVSSPFAPENRKIIYMPLGKMSYTKKEETFKHYVPFFSKLLKKYSDVKGIIHTNSFELSKWIEDSVKDSRLLFHESNNKEEILRLHFSSLKPTVLVSPSVSTGVSFDHEKSRFQVIAKIPYPSLASQKNKLRQKSNPDWYSWRTVAELMQSTGRSVRSINDYADTIIIDSCFGDVLRYSSHFFPKWFIDSITTINKK
jgi:ATP-dependent DNA helicase DinG